MKKKKTIWDKEPVIFKGESLIDFAYRYKMWYKYREMKKQGRF